MRKAIVLAFLLLLGSTVLGATVLREPVADAAAPIASVFVSNDASHPVPVREQNLDANGDVKVHEQGTANVNVTNSTLAVHDEAAVGGAPFTLQTDLTPGGTGAGNEDFGGDITPNVPAGTQLVVTDVFLWAENGNSAFPVTGADCYLHYDPANPNDFNRFPMVALHTSSAFGAQFSGYLQTHLVVKAADPLAMQCVLTSGATAGLQASATASGYSLPASQG